jgi:hypothetical protein
MIKIAFFLAMIFQNSAVCSAQEKESSPDRWQMLQIMHNFDREFSKLRPYLVSKEKFESAKANPEIQKSLDALTTILSSDRPSTVENNPSLNLNFSMMSYHLKTTRNIFEQGNYEAARQNISATMNFCISCHTQVPIAKVKLGGVLLGGEEDSVGYENSEFLFTTRRFTTAMVQFDELVRKYPKSQLTATQVSDIYNRKIAFFARVSRDPKGAIANLEKDLQNPLLPADTRANINKWIGYFKTWDSEKPRIDDLGRKELISFIRKALPHDDDRMIAPADPELVKYLRFSGMLLEQLMKDPESSSAQEVLYDLALFEKKLTKLYPYSLYHAYLRECVVKYPKKEFSKKCFELYENAVTEQYSGRAIPEIIRSTLNVMKRNI